MIAPLRNVRGRQPPGRGFTYAALLVRCLAVFIALQVSGVGHLLIDVASRYSNDTHSVTDCDDPGRPCAPECPSCHCHHPTSVSVPTSNLTELLPVLASVSELASFNTQEAPHGPAPPSVYRPPRANLA